MRALLLSGGLDSSALAYWLRPDVCVTVDYGQLAAPGERAAARAICDVLGLRHELIEVDLRALGSGSMINRPAVSEAAAPEFWPYRNQVLVTLAAMRLQAEGVEEIVFGAVSTDLHADGKPEFVDALDRLMELQEGQLRVSAPAIALTSSELLKTARFPRDLVGLTFSCHVHEYACGQCGGCLKHQDVVDETYSYGGAR